MIYLLFTTIFETIIASFWGKKVGDCSEQSSRHVSSVISAYIETPAFVTPYKDGHISVKDTREKGKKPCNIDLKISLKILFHYPPTFPFI